MLQEHCTPERARKPGPGHSPINGKDSPAPFHKTASGAAVIRYGLNRTRHRENGCSAPRQKGRQTPRRRAIH